MDHISWKEYYLTEKKTYIKYQYKYAKFQVYEYKTKKKLT